MFSHYANVVEELRGEPALSVEDQTIRARNATLRKDATELSDRVADLY